MKRPERRAFVCDGWVDRARGRARHRPLASLASLRSRKAGRLRFQMCQTRRYFGSSGQGEGVGGEYWPMHQGWDDPGAPISDDRRVFFN